MLIPTELLVFETIILVFFLVKTYVLNRVTVGGGIAGALILPIAYYIFGYLYSECNTLEASQVVMRYGQTVLFFVMTIIFIRLSKKVQK
jgi:hypothetical protein